MCAAVLVVFVFVSLLYTPMRRAVCPTAAPPLNSKKAKKWSSGERHGQGSGFVLTSSPVYSEELEMDNMLYTTGLPRLSDSIATAPGGYVFRNREDNPQGMHRDAMVAMVKTPEPPDDNVQDQWQQRRPPQRTPTLARARAAASVQ